LLSEYAIGCMSELEGVGAAAGSPSCDRVPLVPGGEAAGPRTPRWLTSRRLAPGRALWPCMPACPALISARAWTGR